MNKILVVLVMILFSSWSYGQTTPRPSGKKDKKGILYGGFGSHRSYYTPSDITFKKRGGPVFDFTLYDVKAKDEGGVRFKTAPQFSWELGYYFTRKKFGIEYHYDHIKYFVQQNQKVHMAGSIGGTIYNKDTVINPQFVQMEHSDGGNYAMINIVKWIPLVLDKKKEPKLNVIVKAGFGLVNPKTNTTILGEHRDDKYHISGYVTGVEAGLRYNFLEHFFIQGSAKGAFANYTQFLIANGYGRHRFFSGQFIYMLGGRVPL
jgi:hypothetical protein